MSVDTAFEAWPRLIPLRAVVLRWVVAVSMLLLAFGCGYWSWTVSLAESVSNTSARASRAFTTLLAAANAPTYDDLEGMTKHQIVNVLENAQAIVEANRYFQVAKFSPPEVVAHSTAINYLLAALAGLFAVVGLRQALQAMHLSDVNHAHRQLPQQYQCWARFVEGLNSNDLDAPSFFEAVSKIEGQSVGEKTATAVSLPLAAALGEIAKSMKPGAK